VLVEHPRTVNLRENVITGAINGLVVGRPAAAGARSRAAAR
jgi:hypothetical protein